MKKIKVFLCGGENTGWALDTDLLLTKKSLELVPDLELIDHIKQADVVHSVWEEPLAQLNPHLLDGKRIICHACNDILRLYEKPAMSRACRLVGLWIAQAGRLQREFDFLNIPSTHIPYVVDTTVFTPRLVAVDRISSLRRQFSIPQNAFVISNFMRDTDGRDLAMPKEQKAPELFLELVRELAGKISSLHVLLAGPRRHWLRNALKRNNISYTFVGKEVEVDDNLINILSAETINKLYHVSDLHLITSKWEGGPRSVLEAGATRTPVLSTPVGCAEDILPAANIYRSFDKGMTALESIIENGQDEKITDEVYCRILENHVPESNQRLFAEIFNNVEKIPVFEQNTSTGGRFYSQNNPLKRLASGVSSFISTRLSVKPRPLTIGLWHEFHNPPYGGGNQFMMALHSALQRLGVNVVVNKMNRGVDVHICNSAWFDTKLFEKKNKEFRIRMIHRIDGPVTLYRGEGREEDDRIFAMNRTFATTTVFQSAFCYRESVRLGYDPVNPVIISNAGDSTLFYPSSQSTRITNRKIRIISSAWSDNPRKGGPFYQWLDTNMDWERYEYTFVGRIKQKLKNIKHIEAVESTKLADLLRDHDIFLSASMHEPCSNALIEALMCGLPALYRNDGGNPELVGFGGVPFTDENDVFLSLDRLVKNYDSYRSLINLKSIDEIAGRYLAVAQDLLVHTN